MQHLNPFPAAVVRKMIQFTPPLREWEADVTGGKFTVGADITITGVTVSLMEYRDRAGEFTSTAFTTLFS